MKSTYLIGIVSALTCLACDKDGLDNMDTMDTVDQPGVDSPSRGQPGAAATEGDRGTTQDRRAGEPADGQARNDAKADIDPATGDMKIDGEARFSEDGKGVKIVVNVKDAPTGEKGIHIHEKGDCSDVPGDSMGGHFAPQGDKHGLPDAPQDQIHLGDLGNIDIKDDGTGKLEITVEKANLKKGDPMSFLGKALIIHESKDKGPEHQPSGSSGKPIACGVIKEA